MRSRRSDAARADGRDTASSKPRGQLDLQVPGDDGMPVADDERGLKLRGPALLRLLDLLEVLSRD
jgi:hypothetical protein